MSGYDFQAEQQRDSDLRMEALIARLREMHYLVSLYGRHTWITTEDVEELASECGVRAEYLKALNQSREAQGGTNGTYSTQTGR